MGLELRALVVGSGFEPLKAKPADLQGIVLGIEKDFMGQGIDIGKDGQILIQGHRKLSTRFTLKNKKFNR
jgi:hypothetical protein